MKMVESGAIITLVNSCLWEETSKETLPVWQDLPRML